MKLIVLNLPRDMDERNLEELFKIHGTVTACTLVLDDKNGDSKGLALSRWNSKKKRWLPLKNYTAPR